jgi:small-conductance mechanosensitive channel
VFEWQSWVGFGVATAIGLIAVILFVAIASVTVRLIARRHPGVFALLAPVRRRLRILLALIAIWLTVDLTLPERDWIDTIDHVLLIAAIAAGGFLLESLVGLFLARLLRRYPIDVADNRVARRVRTQVLVIRRLATVVIAIVALGSILLTFPGAQAVGTSLLASAGLASVVAGLAAQSTLANVFAGMQLAFTDAIRVDDVVIAEGEWGRIEEITLTYVVVSIWDQRRLILPSTYFTTTPFQNWTRKGSEIMGSVEFDLDWRVSPREIRTQLTAVLDKTDLWDKRFANVQVTDAVGGYVRVRLLMTAADAGSLWDLRCHVREEIVEWLQSKSAASLPRNRVLLVENEPQKKSTPKDTSSDRNVFSGTPDAEARGKEFTGSIPVQSRDAADSDALDREALDRSAHDGTAERD